MHHVGRGGRSVEVRASMEAGHEKRGAGAGKTQGETAHGENARRDSTWGKRKQRRHMGKTQGETAHGEELEGGGQGKRKERQQMGKSWEGGHRQRSRKGAAGVGVAGEKGEAAFGSARAALSCCATGCCDVPHARRPPAAPHRRRLPVPQPPTAVFPSAARRCARGTFGRRRGTRRAAKRRLCSGPPTLGAAARCTSPPAGPG
eukprot:213124-Chlamydomonas_euryale.AAC.1